MDDKIFLPTDRRVATITSEALESLLLYDPARYKGGIGKSQAANGIRFSEFVGPIPQTKPWLTEWELEIKKVQEQAVSELGVELAEMIISTLSTPDSNRSESQPDPPMRLLKDFVSYW